MLVGKFWNLIHPPLKLLRPLFQHQRWFFSKTTLNSKILTTVFPKPSLTHPINSKNATVHFLRWFWKNHHWSGDVKNIFSNSDVIQKLNLNKQDIVKAKMRWVSNDYDFTQPIHLILILTRFLWLLIANFPMSIISHWRWSNNTLYLKQSSINHACINLNQRIKNNDEGD